MSPAGLTQCATMLPAGSVLYRPFWQAIQDIHPPSGTERTRRSGFRRKCFRLWDFSVQCHNMIFLPKNADHVLSPLGETPCSAAVYASVHLSTPMFGDNAPDGPCVFVTFNQHWVQELHLLYCEFLLYVPALDKTHRFHKACTRRRVSSCTMQFVLVLVVELRNILLNG